jgi:hypothetical protein
MAIVSGQTQGFEVHLNPEDTFSFIKIQLTTPQGTPYVNSPVVLRGVNGHVVKINTNNAGYAKVKVPIDDTYSIHCGEHKSMRTVAVSDFPLVTYSFKGYTRRFIYYTFTYRTPEGKILKGEEVVMNSIKTGKKWVDTTNAKGQCYFILPFDPGFRIAVKYHDNVQTVTPRDVGKEYKVMSCDFSWMGSREKERREFVADSLVRARHAEIIAMYDSLAKVKDIDGIAKMDFYVPIEYDSTEWVMSMLKLKAEAYKKQLNVNPKFFEEQQKAVLAPLYRLKKKFAHKLIVTDITGSMSPYMEQVLLWHALNFVDDQRTKYLFFNDGNETADDAKEIGKTGGLYYCQGKMKDFKTIIKTMRKGMSNGYGGDGPENDIEALLAASEKRGSYDELILVADNFSTVRDLELMKELNVPVRIILCGIEDPVKKEAPVKTEPKEEMLKCFRSYKPYSFSEINEEYLNLAHETGGSIHTVKEDVYDLAKMVDGEFITLNGVKYDLVNGRFVLQQKL